MEFAGSSDNSQASSLLNFATNLSTDIKEAMTSKSKKKINPHTFMKKRVKRLNTACGKSTTGQPAKPRARTALGRQRGLDLGPNCSAGQSSFRSPLLPSHLLAPESRSSSLPALPLHPQQAAYHGQHRRSLPTSRLEVSNHALYAAAPPPPPSRGGNNIIDSDLEKVLDDLESLDSPPSQLSSRPGSVSSYSQQALLGEYPLQASPYSDCSEDAYEDSRSGVCSPVSSGAFSGSNSPPMAPVSTHDWVPSDPSYPTYAPAPQATFEDCFDAFVSSCSSSGGSNWLPSAGVVAASAASYLPIVPSSHVPVSCDQSLPTTPTSFELWSASFSGDNYQL